MTSRALACSRITSLGSNHCAQAAGKLKHYNLGTGELADVEVSPKGSFDAGAGPGQRMKTTVQGGAAGIVLDTRGRPFELPDDEQERMRTVLDWYSSLEVYPESYLEQLRKRGG